jgi:hypothetical protein
LSSRIFYESIGNGMFTVGGRRTRISVVALLVIVTGAAALQMVNTLGVRAELLRRCAHILGDDRCEVGNGLASVELSMDASAIGRELRVGRPRLRATTSLVRSSCHGAWVVGLGGRGEVQDLDISTGALEFDAGRGCIDMRRAGTTGRFVDARLRTQDCVIHLAPLEFGAEGTVALRVGAAPDRATVDACRRLMPPAVAGSAAMTLADARIDLETSYAFETIPDGAAPGEMGGGGTGAGAVGAVRRILASAPTSHRLTATLDGSSMTVRVETAPAGESARISLTAQAERGLAGRFFPDAPAGLSDLQNLELQWVLDHGSGTVRVNGTEIRRFPAVATRPAGRVLVSSAECGSARTRRALYFVEAGDDGQALDASQLDGVFTALDTAVSRSGALVAVFVHGWHHSAAPGDSYVCGYSDVLASVEEMEVRAAALSGRAPREILGVYVGWPGALYPSELANSATTFWNRLDAADRLGNPGALLSRLLGGLSQRLAGRSTGAAADRRSSLLVVGHSMGARAVFAALGGEAFGASAVGGPVPDLVLLVNPAFSASLYRTVSARTRECRPGTAPLLLFSSEADAVTRQLYPAGQTVTYPYGSAQPAPFLEHVYTAANFAAFVTHQLTLDVVAGAPPDPEGPQTILGGFGRVPSDSRELYDDNPVVVYRQPSAGRPRAGDAWYRMRLTGVGTPLQTPCDIADGGGAVIAVDRDILPDHGRIFTPPFVEYVVRVLNRRAAASLAGR